MMCYTKKSSCLSFAIAGFDIRIHGLGQVERERGELMLGPFLSQPSAKAMGIEIISNTPIPNIPVRYRLFSSGSHWQLYKVNNQYCYKITSQNKRSDFTSRLAVFLPDFSSGRIYTYSPVGDREFPLTYPLDQLLFIHLASLHHSVFVHGCAVRQEGKGLLFAGASGAGKSTLGGLFKECRDCLVLSDDRIIIKKEGVQYVLYGTPWHGSLPFSSNQKVPLSKVFFLKKAKRNRLIPLSPAESLRRMICFSFLPYWEKAYMDEVLVSLKDLSRQNIFYELSFRPDKSVVEYIENAL
jgi:hypothetical protein